MKKTLLFNILILIFLLIIAEIIACIIHSKADIREIKILYKQTHIQAILTTLNNYYNPRAYNRLYYKDEELRKPIIRNIPNNKEIILYGCSYTHGFTLPEEETFHHHIAKYTNSNIYNYGLVGASPREFLYLLNKIKQPNNNAEYIIYTYMNHHKTRLYSNYRPKVPFYIKKKDGFIYIHYNPILSSSLFFYLQKYLYINLIVPKQKQDKLLIAYLKEANKKIKEKYPKAQFVILVYEVPGFEIEQNLKIWKELENNGIKIIKVGDITNIENTYDEEYTIPNDFHPNSHAWDIIVPALLKELKIL